jgi:hypothetical protein
MSSLLFYTVENGKITLTGSLYAWSQEPGAEGEFSDKKGR